MKVLAILHGSNVPPGVLGEEAERRGHEIDTWSLAWGTPPPGPVDGYGAVMIFGGAMHADQDDRHPWLREENFFLQRLLDLHIPVLGVCLGAQLIAKAAHADVSALAEPEVGWIDVELTEEAADDPLFAGLPPASRRSSGTTTSSRRRPAPRCSRAASAARRRSGWATPCGRCSSIPRSRGRSSSPGSRRLRTKCRERPEEFLAEYDRRAVDWEEFGRALCGNFVKAAERVTVGV